MIVSESPNTAEDRVEEGWLVLSGVSILDEIVVCNNDGHAYVLLNLGTAKTLLTHDVTWRWLCNKMFSASTVQIKTESASVTQALGIQIEGSTIHVRSSLSSVKGYTSS